MINIKQNFSNKFEVFKSAFNYNNLKTYILKFVNDISLSEYTTELVAITDNINYTSILVNEIGSNGVYNTSGDILLPNQGFYTLNILDGSNGLIMYSERVNVKGDTNAIPFDEDEVIIIHEEDPNYNICQVIEQCDYIQSLATIEYVDEAIANIEVDTNDYTTAGLATVVYVDEQITNVNSELNTKQDELINQVNIKSINGTSILGSGNLVISGGGGGSSNDYTTAGLATKVYVDTQDSGLQTQINTKASTTSVALKADKTYVDSADATLQTNINAKASTTYVDTQDSGLQTQINTKASTSSVALKADITYVDSQDATKQATLVSGTNIKTINSTSILGSGNLNIPIYTSAGLATVVYVDGKDSILQTNINAKASTTYVDTQDATLQTNINAKQATLVSGTNIKTINSTSVLGSGDLSIPIYTSAGLATVFYVDTQDALKQNTLVSSFNIKTINSTSVLGSGNIAVQPTLVSATNIKTVNGSTILGSGDLTVSSTPSANSITRAMLVNGSATSIIGRSANSTGAVADIVAGSDGQVLKRVGGVLGFNAIGKTDLPYSFRFGNFTGTGGGFSTTYSVSFSPALATPYTVLVSGTGTTFQSGGYWYIANQSSTGFDVQFTTSVSVNTMTFGWMIIK